MERGGPTTQGGIFYQNTVAAGYLIDLLDLSTLAPRERVLEVRLEAPAAVDDIVVTYADGHSNWIQAKQALATTGDAWTALWTNVLEQTSDPRFRACDQIIIAIGTSDSSVSALRDLCERAATSVNFEELEPRLSEPSKVIAASIQKVIGLEHNLVNLLARTLVDIAPIPEIEYKYDRRSLNTRDAIPPKLLGTLRDIAGGESRKRMIITAPALRRRLQLEYKIDVTEPAEWGLDAYKLAVQRLSTIEIPGTGLSGPASELFVWPRATLYAQSQASDFEDEDPRWGRQAANDTVDLELFPSQSLDRFIVVAGPGYGKSTLLTAVSRKLVDTVYVPVVIHLGLFASSKGTVGEFLSGQINRDFDVRVDWARLAEHGLLVLLFDGLDEIPLQDRRAVLDKISNYLARNPKVPLILTVRDPAALAGRIDSQVIELLPLENEDIVKFGETLNSRIEGFDGWQFIMHLQAYPDLARLARIPLFLAMLLGSRKPGEALPTSRSDLIERYLKTLFSPHEHKTLHTQPSDSVHDMREAAEALAFAGLEQHRIGSGEKDIRDFVRRLSTSASAANAIVDTMLSYGLLRRAGANTTHLQFPYPIVQEYLAACHLIKTAPNSLGDRIADAASRPWAQVLQFGLELHPAPEKIISTLLSADDDAFYTALRLVGRSVANGAKVGEDITAQITKSLAQSWYHATSGLRGKIGRLIADGFATPLTVPVREKLGFPHLMYDGAADIVFSKHDPHLTVEVVSTALERELNRHTYLHALQPAINECAAEVFGVYDRELRLPDISADKMTGLSNLIGLLKPFTIPFEPALQIGQSEAWPAEVRIAAYRMASSPPDEAIWPLVDSAIQSKDFNLAWHAEKAIVLADDPSSKLRSYFVDETIELKRKLEILDRLETFFPELELRSSFVSSMGSAPTPKKLRQRLDVFDARNGSLATFERLVDGLDRNPLEIASATISILGQFPAREWGERAIEQLRKRRMTSNGALRLASSAATALRYVYETFSFRGGTLNRTAPHASIESWRGLVEEWSDTLPFSLPDKLRILSRGSEIGSELCVDRLEQLLLSINDPDSSLLDEKDDYGHTLSTALQELHVRRRNLPINIIEKFARSKRPNVPYVAVQMIASHANLEALTQLILLHNQYEDWHIRSSTCDALEVLSGRLGVRVRRRGKMLLVIE